MVREDMLRKKHCKMHCPDITIWTFLIGLVGLCKIIIIAMGIFMAKVMVKVMVNDHWS